MGAAIEANSRCEAGGLKPTPRFTAAMANMKSTDFALPLKRVAPPRGSQAVQATRKGRTTAGRTTTRGRGRSVASDPVGVFAPLGEWDPAGYTTKSDATDAKIAY